MPDQFGRFKGISLGGKAGETLDSIRPRRVRVYVDPDNPALEVSVGGCPFKGCPCQPEGTGELCDDDHCREL